ncbi:MAG: hypothetical protein LBC49_00455, partial [Bacteroidales bacterium]|nr:hypothetical protein [Bacteroidales bacterium]
MKQHLAIPFLFSCILHFLLFQQYSLYAYTPAPSCPDFTNLNGTYVEAFTGKIKNPFARQGVVNGRHTLITAQGTDPNTNKQLPLLPPDETSVIRLGNSKVGGEAEALIYHFIVEAANPVLLLKFAVVLEDPNHPFIAQPRFVIRITDKDGNLLEDCAEYDVSAGAGIPGFQTFKKGSRTVRWRPWTNVGLDMTKFIGQEVQVQFITYDCDYNAHYGYAYFTAHCISNVLQLQNCDRDSFTAEAPDNFASYLWDNGDESRTTTRSIADNVDTTVTCAVTSATGCKFTLYGYIVNYVLPSGNIYKDTICEGEQYNKHNFNLPAQQTGEKHFFNTYLDVNTCDDDITDELLLTVLHRYNYIEASICQGYDYTDSGFNIIQPAAGIRYDTLITGQDKYCGDIQTVLKLTVNPHAAPTNALQGDTSPCTGEMFTYFFEGAEVMTKYTWSLPGNAIIVKGEDTSSITLYFTDDTPCDIILNSENGCGTRRTPLHITPRQSYHFYFSENVCVGEEYNAYDFNLGIQNETGYFVHNRDFRTVNGCDSSITLALTVAPVPQVFIQGADSLLCNAGTDVSLFAIDT